MHIRHVSAPKKALTIDCTWLEENLPDSLLELILAIVNFFKAPEAE